MIKAWLKEHPVVDDALEEAAWAPRKNRTGKNACSYSDSL